MKISQSWTIRTVSPTVVSLKNSFNRLAKPFRFLKDLSGIEKENQLLRQQLAEEKAKNAQLNTLSYENEILKKELNLQPQEKTVLGATVIGQSPLVFQSQIYIDKGRASGVKKDMAVLVNGFLIGTVLEAQEKTATVALLTEHRTLIPVVFQESRAIGLLKSSFGGLVVEEIPASAKIKTGEKIVTSGLVGKYLPDIPVGEVKEIISSKSDIFQTATISSPIDFQTITYVFLQLNQPGG